MQYLRRTIQITVILILIIIPFVNYYGIKIEQKDDFAIQDSVVLSFIHSFFIGLDRDDAVEMTHKVIGSVWTMDINGFNISDPLAAVESSVITLYLYTPLLLSVIIPVIITMILGKVYCGWICPMHLLLEINDWFRKKLAWTGYNTRDIKFSRNTKYWILIVGIIVASFAGRPLLALIYPPAIISREIFYKIYSGIWGHGVLILVMIFFFELILSRRWWCRYICPGGAVYSLLSRFSFLRIKRSDDFCDSCGDCVPVCPYDLEPMTKELGMDCDRCGICIDVCKPGALKYKFNIVQYKNSRGSARYKKSNLEIDPVTNNNLQLEQALKDDTSDSQNRTE